MNERELELEALNKSLRESLGEWIEKYARKGELPLAKTNVLMALLVGPREDLARRWLRGKTTPSSRDAADSLAEAAWNSLHMLRSRSRSS